MGGFLSGRTSLTTVNTGDLADNAVTLAKMAGGTDGNLIGFDSSGDPAAIATGTAGDLLTSGGAGAASAMATPAASGITLGTEQATASGGSVTFSSIPSGTKRVTINFAGVSLSASDNSMVQIGDGGGIETTSYTSGGARVGDSNSTASGATTTTGFHMQTLSSSNTINGTMVLTLEDSTNNTWVSTHTMYELSRYQIFGGGLKSLSAELTQLVFIPDSGTLDAGAINVMYE